MLLHIRRTGKVAIGEMCVCGHPKSVHGSHTHKAEHLMLRVAEVGNCCETACKCDKFRWAGWIYDEAKQQKLSL